MPIRKTSDKAISKNLKQLPHKGKNEVIMLTVFEGKNDHVNEEDWSKEIKRRRIEMKSGGVKGLTLHELEIELSTGKISEIETDKDYAIRFHPKVLEEFKIIKGNHKEKGAMDKILKAVKAKMKEIDQSIGTEPAKLNKQEVVSVYVS